MKTQNTETSLGRRGFLRTLGLGAAGLALSDLLPAFAPRALASGGFDTTNMPFLVFATFDGGWDQLLALDPRDATLFGESAGIHAAYDLVQDTGVQSVLQETGGTGVRTPAGSAIDFGPACGRLPDYFADLCVVRGMDMGTLTHEVGRRYFLTGKFPRGLQASGSSLSTWVASEVGDLTPVPNLVVGMESYNEGLETFATGLTIQSSADLQYVLKAIGEPLPGATAAAVDAYVRRGGCFDQLLDQDGRVSEFLAARTKSETLAGGTLAAHFDFNGQASPEIQQVFQHFGINPVGFQAQAELQGPKGQAAIAAQAITHEVSQVVSIRLAAGIDHHDNNWSTEHGTALREGFEALCDLIDYLKATTDARGQSYWSRTVLIASSEFARTPKLNGRDGRDHHLASSCLVAGAGIRGNTLIGATEDAQYGTQPIDPATGAVDLSGSGVIVRPPDVHATVLKALGLGYDHIDNQSPVVLDAMLA